MIVTLASAELVSITHAFKRIEMKPTSDNKFFESIEFIAIVYQAHAECLGVRVYFVCFLVFSMNVPKHFINQMHKHFFFVSSLK